MSQVVPPPPLFPCELLPCLAAANRASRLCSITEKTRGQIAAGVSNPGAGARTGAGAGAGAGAAGVLLECCVTFSTKRCPTSSLSDRNYHRLKHALPSPMQSSSDNLFLLGSRKTLNFTKHLTEHFPIGGANYCINFQTHELLFLFPVRGSTIVTVVRFLFFCPRAPERRALYREMVASQCPSLSPQCSRGSLLWLMFVSLSVDYATQNHVVSNL